MKCHYKVLGLDLNATEEDIKRGYRKLALKWHPDKNLENNEEATEQFRLVQAAYDVLSDPQEKAWYDRHRIEILHKKEYENFRDTTSDLLEFFTPSAYRGFGNDAKGFYAVYRDVFKRVSEDDKRFQDEDDSEEVDEMPEFGDGDSCYDEVVHPFYAAWQSYCTKLSYVWVEKYDVHEAPERRIARLIEKENKKERDKEKKKRNEIIRDLVKFVRKRDPRVQANREKLQEVAIQQAEKAKQKRDELLRSRVEEAAKYEELHREKNEEHANRVSQLEDMLKREFGFSSDEESVGSDVDEDLNDEDEEEEEDHVDELYCVACNKHFKTNMAVKNHEKSKKHKEKITKLQAEMKEEEDLAKNSQQEDEEEELDDFEEDFDVQPKKLTKKQKKQRKKQASFFAAEVDEIDAHDENTQETAESNPTSNEGAPSNETIEQKSSADQTGVQSSGELDSVSKIDDDVSENVEPSTAASKNTKKNRKNKSAKKDNPKPPSSQVTHSGEAKANLCVTCNREYPTRNKLFQHLKTSGHALLVQDNKNSSQRKKKGRK